MGYLRKECEKCHYWKKLGEHCGAIMHGMKCVEGPLPEPTEEWNWVRQPDGSMKGRLEAKAKDTQVAGDHYKKMGVEPWDVVDTWPLEQRIGAYRHGALKYLMRMGSKDQNAQEIAKGKHYMEKLLEVLNDA